jgi:group I intron endonuclease
MDCMPEITSSNAGIYSITNTANDKVYVGCALSICRSIAQHRWALRSNKHRNPLLQASWNEHGEAAFQFAVLEFCLLRKRGGRAVRKDVQNLESREQFWINTFGSLKASKGFNIGGTCPSFYFFFLMEEVMKSKGLALDELMKLNAENRMDKLTRLDLEKELAGRMNFLFHGPKPRSKAGAAREAARQDAVRMKAASETLERVMRTDLDRVMELNAFHGRIANGWRRQVKTRKPNASIGISVGTR